MLHRNLHVRLRQTCIPKAIPRTPSSSTEPSGERSIFHETFGYYAHGVGEDTAVLPAGWKDRLVPIHNENTRGATGWCLEPHDLAVSKLIAGREKGVQFVSAMLRHGLAREEILRTRLDAIPFPYGLRRL